MTYDAQELAGGRPIFLYAFTLGATTTRFTSTEADYTDGNSPSNTWTAKRGLAHSPIKTSSPEKEILTLTMPRSDGFAETLAATTDTSYGLTISRVHIDDGEIRVVFKGFVGASKRSGNVINFECKFDNDRARRGALHSRIERMCRHVLYGANCGLTRGDFEQSDTATAISGKAVTLSGSPVDPGSPADSTYFSGGLLRFGDYSQVIRNVSGSTVNLTSSFPELEAEIASSGTATVYLAPGCPLRVGICNSRFNNAANFGGWPRLPSIGAFEGRSIV